MIQFSLGRSFALDRVLYNVPEFDAGILGAIKQVRLKAKGLGNGETIIRETILQ